ncbi:MAG TPA: UDP-2,3-diacylglucosamine diphosphatase [Burkholderiaceae bacterium]|nr:UDP-2,3-diacylglucosamine diphosphatase [Burkholderiaceae bacterium]
MASTDPVQPVPARAATLERLSLREPIFVSDLHLCAQRPRTLQRFLGLLGQVAGHVAELVILGDLFEYWAGDDTLQEGASARLGSETANQDDLVGREVAAALHQVATRGTVVYLMHGNRDILLGTQFLAKSGAQLLADPAIALIGGSAATSDATGLATLLAHGDAYCTLDLPYQAFRRQARDAQFQAAFLARPLPERRQLIGQARERSEATKQQLDMQIMDVTPAAIEQALRGAGVRHMVHGHTHRPARHEFILDGAPAIRWVLPDWDQDTVPPRGGGLRWVHGTLEALTL